jgi:hypothetical protein
MDIKKRDQQLAALLAALSIIGFALIYWGMQIQDVLETLAMAYG